MLKTISPTVSQGSGGGGTTSNNGAIQLITETIATPNSSVIFSGIPQTYRDLEIRVRGRGTGAANDAGIALVFNGDGGAHYDWQQAFCAAAYAGVTGNNQTSLASIQIAAATAPNNYSGAASITIANYRDTTFFKSIFAIGNDWSGGNVRSMIATGQWKNTSAINNVTVSIALANNSVVSLYGHF